MSHKRVLNLTLNRIANTLERNAETDRKLYELRAAVREAADDFESASEGAGVNYHQCAAS